nr:response regulator transcription factor [Streptomyces sp. TRM68416]
MDENTIFREGLRTVIARDDGLRVVGHSAGNAVDLVAGVAEARPDILLLGLEHVTGRVESIVTEVLRASPGTDIIILSWDVADGTLQRLMELGMRAYLPKDVPHRYLLSMLYVSRLDDSQAAFSWPRPGGPRPAGAAGPRAAARRVPVEARDSAVRKTGDPAPPWGAAPEAYAQPSRARSQPPRGFAASPSVPQEHGLLSLREREVVQLVGKAMTNAQIGRQLGISEGTVKRHLHSIFVKLHAVSRLDAVNKAVSLSLIMLQ